MKSSSSSRLLLMKNEIIRFVNRLELIYHKVVDGKIQPSADNVVDEKGWLTEENFSKLYDLKEEAVNTKTPKDNMAYFEFAVRTGSEYHFEEALKFLGFESNQIDEPQILSLLLKGYSNAHEHYNRTIKYKMPVGYDPKEKLNHTTKRYWETFAQINSLRHSTALKVKK